MKGNTLNEFISDLCVNGGPEKEFVCYDKYYIIQAEGKENDSKTYLRLDIYERVDDEAGQFINTVWFAGDSLTTCVDAFVDAKVFDGKTIYEAEKEIEVLFG